MGEQTRRSPQQHQGKGVSTAGEPDKKVLEPKIWQRHVEEEMERRAREHEPAPRLSHFAEEYAEIAMRGVEAAPNEYKLAEERGEKHGAGDEGYLAGG
jgi:pyruvate-formate lyase